MATQNAHTADDIIPLLEDPIREPEAETKPKGRNPFLPYEHLERLAREREEFNRQFAELMKQRVEQKRAQTAAVGAAASQSIQDLRHPDLERIIHLTTQKVVAEYLPQIEQRIRAEVIRHLNSLDFRHEKE